MLEIAHYVERAANVRYGKAPVRVAFTPLHGVGGETAVLALARAGFTDVHVVASQAVPDPAFPTVAFPNPEEKGAMDAVLARLNVHALTKNFVGLLAEMGQQHGRLPGAVRRIQTCAPARQPLRFQPVQSKSGPALSAARLPPLPGKFCG